jgi:protein ImuB
MTPTRHASHVDLPLSGGGDHWLVCSGHERDAIALLPLAALRFPTEIIEALSQVGLKRIADVLDRPRAPLAARFGADFVRRLDQALGREDEPIAPRLPIPAAIAEQRFAEPIALERDVLGTIEKLSEKLGALLERRGEGARLLQAALFRTDGRVFRIEVGTSEPLREAARIRHLFANRLGVIDDEVDPGFGYDMLRLAALVTERSEPTQTGLAQPDHAAELAHLIDRLGARFGLRRVTRFVEQDTHIPEFAVMAVAASLPSPLWEGSTAVAQRRRSGWGSEFLATSASNSHDPPPQPPPERVFTPVFDGLRGEGARGLATVQDSLAPTRPIRMLARPELVEAIAEVPDGPPVRFRWRYVLHEVAHAEGPERIAMEWWRDRSGLVLMRDYFRVESHEGLRVWIFRAWPKPLTQEGEEREGPKQEFVRRRTIGWFVHGVFA